RDEPDLCHVGLIRIEDERHEGRVRSGRDGRRALAENHDVHMLCRCLEIQGPRSRIRNGVPSRDVDEMETGQVPCRSKLQSLKAFDGMEIELDGDLDPAVTRRSRGACVREGERARIRRRWLRRRGDGEVVDASIRSRTVQSQTLEWKITVPAA